MHQHFLIHSAVEAVSLLSWLELLGTPRLWTLFSLYHVPRNLLSLVTHLKSPGDETHLVGGRRWCCTSQNLWWCSFRPVSSAPNVSCLDSPGNLQPSQAVILALAIASRLQTFPTDLPLPPPGNSTVCEDALFSASVEELRHSISTPKSLKMAPSYKRMPPRSFFHTSRSLLILEHGYR